MRTAASAATETMKPSTRTGIRLWRGGDDRAADGGDFQPADGAQHPLGRRSGTKP